MPQFIVGFALLAFSQSALAAHPLDPLTQKEILAAAKAVSTHAEFPKGGLFPQISLQEPHKTQPSPRQAFVIVLDRPGGRTFEALVDLATFKVASWNAIRGVQPPVLVEEYNLAGEIVKADAGWQAAVKKRGFTDLSKLQVDAWATGTFYPPELRGHRLLRAITYHKGKTANFYGAPIEGLVALVDVGEGKVVRLYDGEPVSTPPDGQDLDEKSIGRQRAVSRLSVSQPGGAGFRLRGNEVEWQSWRFRFSLHPRDGLVLHNVTYQDAGKARSVLHRASLSEMVVPYGDPSQEWLWRNAFDVGEYGLGRLAAPLDPGQDVPSYAKVLDAVFADDFGKPYVQPRAVAIYEKDAGLLWKHYDIYTKANHSRRARELIVSMIAAIGNYDYAIQWVFQQDGAIEFRPELTGIMLPKGTAQEAASCPCHQAAGGHLVSRRVIAPHHQHFFNVRLDLDVDGPKNTVVEVNASALPEGEGNPGENGILMEETVLATEAVARRGLSLESARKWKVFNPEARNALGQNTGYALIPGESTVPYLSTRSPVRRRAGFLEHAFWATLEKPGELYAAGDYVNQSDPEIPAGLAAWSTDEPLVASDVVLWYTFGITHLPRPEEWPIMTVHRTGFRLMPVAFFSRNPSLDVPRAR